MTHMHTAAATTTTAAADHQYATMAARMGTPTLARIGCRSAQTALEHYGLTPRLRFGNRQCVHGLKMEAELASDEFVEDAADPDPIDEEQ
jgi:hypothetical protein